MCSVTFWPKPRGYLLAMNRDESRTREPGLPPSRFIDSGRAVVHPREPKGGTWISLNDQGVGFALINWYAIPERAPRPAASRGQVVISLRSLRSMELTAARLIQLPLERMDPFRLLGIFPHQLRACEWRWNLKELLCWPHDWSPQQWCSSGFDEPTAQQIRGATFASMRAEADAGTLPWLRRLHGSHFPARGPFSVCMHRADAATVSYTELDVGDRTATVSYSAEPLCCALRLESETLSLSV